MKRLQIKKLALSSIAAATMLAAAIPAAQAATAASGNFNLIINLTSVCAVSTPGDVTLNYTSMGAAANASSAFDITCTNTLPYSMATDVAGGTAVGLNYTLATSAASGTGNGVAQGYTVDAGITAGQAGTCGTALCSSTTVHTVTVTY
jgi:hypothetical protein